MSKTNLEKYRSELGEVKASDAFRQAAACLLRNETEQTAEPKKKHRALKYALVPALAVMMICALLFGNFFTPINTVQASENLMEGITAKSSGSGTSNDEEFVSAQANFSVSLLQKTVQKGKNSLVSPFSVASALGMTANGASGETQKQFEQLLGGGMKLDDLNRNYSAMARRLGTDSKLQIANSVWYDKGRINVKKDFLQRNADYFGAGAYQLDFSKTETVGRINSWVKDHTGGKIDKITDKTNPDDVMFLINALYFEDEWQRQYDSSRNENFKAPGGTVSAPFMASMEKLIHDESAEGMIKSFKDERYAFAAILPKESIGLDNYISQLTGDSFLDLIQSADGKAEFYLPKFKYEFEEELNNPLQAMGLSDAFKPEKADFSSMGSSPRGKLVISEVLHKTFIEVDQMGAKAGAVTEVAASTTSAMIDPKIVKFDRPFVYAIIDTQTNLPVFIGTVINPVQ